ncbi:hypothetical protein WA158_008447 [Blastocystis sp. Blastoise]
MSKIPAAFNPSKNYQTIKNTQTPISITNNQSLMDQPYVFDFCYNSVDSPYIDFSNSYIELWLNVRAVSASEPPATIQECNLYSIIDKLAITMTYISPTGVDVAVNYTENSIDSSKARKFIALKELSKDEIDRSVYCASGEDLYAVKDNVESIKFMEYSSGSLKDTVYKVAIPFMLISGLGTFNCAIKVKTLKIQVTTNYLRNMCSNIGRITQFNLSRAYITFKQIYDINWKGNPMALMRCIPNNCQLCTFSTPCYEWSYTNSGTQNVVLTPSGTFINSRSVNFIPDYCLMYFTDKAGSMFPINTEIPTTVSFQIGGINVTGREDYPPQYKKLFNSKSSTNNGWTGYLTPNIALYNDWRANCHEQSPLIGEKWYEQPLYIFPISSSVDVNNQAGVEVNITLHSTRSTTVSTAAGKTSYWIPYVNFIFVKFIRNGAMN